MGRKRTVEDYHKLAEKKGLEWIDSNLPFSTKTYTLWKCKICKVEREATYNSLRDQKVGCRNCHLMPIRNCVSDYYKLAKKQGLEWAGSELPFNVRVDTQWKCENCGHEQKASYDKISKHKRPKSSCPVCYKGHRKTIRDYHELAKGKNLEWIGLKFPQSAKVYTQWRCKICSHEFKMSYDTISNNQGEYYCPGRCKNERISISNRKIFPDHYRLLAENRGFEWLGPEVNNSTTKTFWKCKYGHKWDAHYSSIKHQETGCPICNESRGEKRIAEILSSYGIYPDRQKKFDPCQNQTHLPFDFHFTMGKLKFLIEYQGEQHYRPIDFFGGEEGFIKTQENDKIKAQFAKDYDYILITIPYTEFNSIRKIIRDKIEFHTGKSINEIIRMNKGKTRSWKFDPYKYSQVSFF